MKDLKSIMKENPKSLIPNMINDVSVNEDPESIKIKNILDSKRIGSNQKTFYLVKTIDKIYY